MSDPRSLEGKRVGSYRLEERLGRGGMAEVYAGRAEDGTPVAVKLLHPVLAQDEKAAARFEREVGVVQALDHPHVIRIVDVGTSRDRLFLVMELLGGPSFADLLERGNRPRDLVATLAQVAHGLAHAHASDVVHRDVKPDNVLLDRSGRAVIADFGLARLSDSSSLTSDGAFLGTAKYVSPEQARGGDASAASDVYAMGVMIYEAVAGELPFASRTQHGYLFQHATTQPRRPRRRRGFSPALGRLAMQCLAKEPDDRPDMATVAAELDAAVAWRPPLRRALAFAATVAALAIVAGAVAVLVEPSLLDPACDGWFGAPAARAVRDAAEAAREWIQ